MQGLRGRLPGWQAERFGMGPAVVLSQDLAEAAGPVRDGAAADLAARDRKMGNGHGKTAGTGLAHRLHDASLARLTLHAPRACKAADSAALDGAGPESYRSTSWSRLSFVNVLGRPLSDQTSILRRAVAPVSPGADRVKPPLLALPAASEQCVAQRVSELALQGLKVMMCPS